MEEEDHEKEEEGEEKSRRRRSYCFSLSSSLHFFKFIEHCLDVRMFVQ